MFVIKIYSESCTYYLASHGGDLCESMARRFSSEEEARGAMIRLRHKLGILSPWEVVRASR